MMAGRAGEGAIGGTASLSGAATSQAIYLGALADRLEARDRGMRGHARRVASYAACLAARIGLPREEIERVRISGFLHDIGKIGVPAGILRRPGALDPAQIRILREHPEIGCRLVEPLGLPEAVLAGIRHHHEQWSGKGYPHGLAGEEIPLAARIVQVADAYDAMTSHRCYRRACPPARAGGELLRFAGTQFDAALVRPFLELLEEVQRDAAARTNHARTRSFGTLSRCGVAYRRGRRVGSIQAAPLPIRPPQLATPPSGEPQ